MRQFLLLCCLMLLCWPGGPHFPPYLVLHVDINETVIAGDGAKGYSAEQTLQLVASKHVEVARGTTLYQGLEREHPEAAKHDVEAAVLRWLEEGPLSSGKWPGAWEQVRTAVERYAAGCVPVALPNGRTLVVLKAFLHLLQSLREDPGVQGCLIIFRTFGPDMGDVVGALMAIGAMAPEQWRGYGEFVYESLDRRWRVDNRHKLDKATSEYVAHAAAQNQAAFTSSLEFNPQFNPAAQSVGVYFPRHPLNQLLAGEAAYHRITSALLGGSAIAHQKVQFLGLRDVFAVWQRRNRHHAKPFYLLASPTGRTATEPLEVFLDDNAYEEAPKGRPGPYIVTVFRAASGVWTEAPVDQTHVEVIRPDRERAYLDGTYYSSLVKEVCSVMLKRAVR